MTATLGRDENNILNTIQEISQLPISESILPTDNPDKTLANKSSQDQKIFQVKMR